MATSRVYFTALLGALFSIVANIWTIKVLVSSIPTKRRINKHYMQIYFTMKLPWECQFTLKTSPLISTMEVNWHLSKSLNLPGWL